MLGVARDIIALGGEALLDGALGDDAEDLVAGPLIEGDRITGRVVRAHDHPTTTKVRVPFRQAADHRLDIERRLHLGPHDIEAICGWFTEAAEGVAAIVLSDYAKGVLVPALVRRVIDIARARRIPVVVDPKSGDMADTQALPF